MHGEIYQGKKIKMALTLVTVMAIEWYNLMTIFMSLGVIMSKKMDLSSISTISMLIVLPIINGYKM